MSEEIWTPGSDLKILSLRWDEYREWFAANITQGMHIGFVAPTGAGKTTFWTGILPVRKFVLAFDPKGGDSTLKTLGWERLTKWPPDRRARRAIERGEPFRAIVGAPIERMEDFPRLKALFRTVLREVFAEGGWTVYVDELQVACDRRIMGLAAEAETLLIAARDRDVSFWSSYQKPTNVPKAASDQASWLVVGRQRDTDVINRLGEMAGRPKPEMRGLIRELAPFTLAMFSNRAFDPVVVTRPDPPRRRRPRA